MAHHSPIKYRGHILLCAPLERPDGLYSAQVLVGSANGFNGSFSELGTFESEQAAAQHAATWVMSWIDHNVIPEL